MLAHVVGVSARVMLAGVLTLFLTGCPGPSPAESDDAGEAVVRHHAARLLEYSGGPWTVICLSREARSEQEPDEVFLRRFTSDALPIVSSERCGVADTEADTGAAERVVTASGERAVEVRLDGVRRTLAGDFVVVVWTSTGTNDYTQYACDVIRRDGRWRVETCLVTALTFQPPRDATRIGDRECPALQLNVASAASTKLPSPSQPESG